MTIEAELYNVLKVICPRTFPDFAPVSTQRPYVTYQQIGGDVVSYLDPSMPDKKNGHFQINVWADRRSDAAALALQIETALVQASAFTARPLSAPASDFDPDIPVYGARQDFSIWSDR